MTTMSQILNRGSDVFENRYIFLSQQCSVSIIQYVCASPELCMYAFEFAICQHNELTIVKLHEKKIVIKTISLCSLEI